MLKIYMIRCQFTASNLKIILRIFRDSFLIQTLCKLKFSQTLIINSQLILATARRTGSS